MADTKKKAPAYKIGDAVMVDEETYRITAVGLKEAGPITEPETKDTPKPKAANPWRYQATPANCMANCEVDGWVPEERFARPA